MEAWVSTSDSVKVIGQFFLAFIDLIRAAEGLFKFKVVRVFIGKVRNFYNIMCITLKWQKAVENY